MWRERRNHDQVTSAHGIQLPVQHEPGGPGSDYVQLIPVVRGLVVDSAWCEDLDDDTVPGKDLDVKYAVWPRGSRGQREFRQRLLQRHLHFEGAAIGVTWV